MTRSFAATRKFATALLDEAATLFLNGEPETARLILRDLVNATVGFEGLAPKPSMPSKSLHRMLSERGNPSMDNMAAIFDAIRTKLKVGTVTAKRLSHGLTTKAGGRQSDNRGLNRLTSFQRLALWTTATTYFLILVGGLVRASGAGLGCPDWPRCFGGWVPPMSVAELPPQFDPSQFNPTLMWTEYLNRLLGATVGLLIVATAVSAWRHHRRDPRILWTTIAAVLLTGFQGWLGGRVVAHELAAWIVTVHMIVALVIVQMLLYVTVTAGGAGQAGGPAGVRPWAMVLIAITLIQIVLGTQVRGGVDAALDAGVARDAALTTVGAYDLLHRDAAFVVLLGCILFTFWLAARRAPMVVLRWSWVSLGLAVLQVGLGVVMVYVTLLPAAQVLHLTVASLFLGAQTVVLLVVESAD